jgi:hypothetical protein
MDAHGAQKCWPEKIQAGGIKVAKAFVSAESESGANARELEKRGARSPSRGRVPPEQVKSAFA